MRTFLRLSEGWRRVLWFVGIYACSVIGLGVVAAVLRFWLNAH